MGFIGLLAKLHAWDESAMFFDGSSIGKLTPIFLLNRCVLTRTHTVAYILALAVYVTVTIPSLRTIVTPVAGETRNDKIEAMRVLSAGNTIIVVILVGVLLLQVRLNRMDFFDIFNRYPCRLEKNMRDAWRRKNWRKSSRRSKKRDLQKGKTNKYLINLRVI